MSDEQDKNSYWKRVDRFIDIANEETQDADRGKVSGSLLFAAARHNAFLVAATASDKETLKRVKDEAVEHNVSQYRKMLTDNLNEYLENYDQYVMQQKET